jgi:hypothetical protein
MAIFTDRFLFLHIPKTGGMWVKSVLTSMGIPFQELGHQHEHFPSLKCHKPADFFDSRFIFTFVRHPITWYQSRWAFRMKMGWQPKHPLDWNCASNDFNNFVERAIGYHPGGWCSWEFSSYIDHTRPNGKPLIDFVGRTENLADDLINALQKSGHDVNPDLIKSYHSINASTSDGRPSSELAKYDPSTFKKLISVEKEAIGRFYSDFVVKFESKLYSP